MIQIQPKYLSTEEQMNQIQQIWYNEILFSDKEEQIADTCNNMANCPTLCSEPKKPDTLQFHLYETLKAHLLWVQGESDLLEREMVCFGLMKMFYIFIDVVSTGLYICQICRPVHLKQMYFIVCELYLDKVEKFSIYKFYFQYILKRKKAQIIKQTHKHNTKIKS